MAVQGKNESTICERCFASVKSGSEFCPECGAPIGKAAAEGSDAAIYPELARANLLRMRGDYSAALDHCRGILRKFPNNVTANQLLGDICVEMDDLEQAKEWYELALDIAPDSEQIRNKLEATKQKLEQRETAGLVEQLGLPPEKPKNGLVAIGIAVLVIAVGAVAYVVGSGTKKAPTNTGPTHTTMTAPPNTQSSTGTTTNPGYSTGTTPSGTGTPSLGVGPSEDRTLAQLIAQRSSEGSRIIGVTKDPRGDLLMVTFTLGESDDERAISAKLAEAVFENTPARLLTLRAVRGDVLAYVADVHRETYEETKTDAWKQQNTDPNAAAKHFLTQEWYPNGPTVPLNEGNTQTPTTDGNTGP